MKAMNRLGSLMVRLLHLKKISTNELGISAPDLHEYMNSRMVEMLSPRYQRLVSEVLHRLPLGWNAGWIVRIEESGKTPFPVTGCIRYTSAEVINEGRSARAWVLTLFTRHLDGLSDKAVRWVIAHRFAHFASCAPSGLSWRATRNRNAEKDDRAADAQAHTWGFSEERRHFEEESPKSLPSGSRPDRDRDESVLGQTG